ncbi:MAG: DNRLRE domain-containing protein [Planctomycetota bacterium]
MFPRNFINAVGIVSAAVLGLATPMKLSGAEVTLGASKDNTLFESSSGGLSNGSGQYFFCGRTAQAIDFLRRGLIAFDLTAVPAGSTITNAVLTLNMSQTIVGAQTVSLHRASQDWGESTSNALVGEGSGTVAEPGDATWLHTFSPGGFWTTAGGDFEPAASAATAVSGLGFYAWQGPGMVSDLQTWLDSPSSNFGWVVRGPESGVSAKRFDSRENPVDANRPRLVITFTPPAGFSDFVRGDCNLDGSINIADPISLLSFLFPASGTPTPPGCLDACDANDDEQLNVADAVRLIDALFGTPASPLPPPAACAGDPGGAALDCQIAPNCP